jgi:cell division protein DivIC
VNLRRVILTLYLAIFAGLTITAGVYFMDAKEEYDRLKAVEVRNRGRLDEAERELRDEEKILNRLRTDRAYVERVIRRKLGYAKPDESIFRFDD